MNTVATLFSGGGGYDIGAMAAGYAPIWGIEYIPEIAAVYRRNIGDHIIVESLLNVDPSTLARPTLLHASPPCPNFSNAKAGGEETSDDIALAQKVAEFVTVLRPKFFTLENVYQYRNSQSWQIVARALYDNGYAFDYWHVNAADYGVPQTRQRMIAMARLDGRKPMLPRGTHEEEPQPSLFGTSPGWVSWYEAIEDLLLTLPDDKFAPWQLKKLPEKFYQKGFVVCNGDAFRPVVASDAPSLTVSASNGFKAFIMDAANPHSNGQTKHRWGNEPVKTLTASDGAWKGFVVNESSTMAVRWANAPAATQVAAQRSLGQRAFVVNGTPNDNGQAVTALADNEPVFTQTSTAYKRPIRGYASGRVVRMTPRCMARWQTFPDWYEFPTASEGQIKRKLERLTICGQRASSFDGWLGEYLLTNDALACRVIGNAVPSLLAQRIVESLCPSN